MLDKPQSAKVEDINSQPNLFAALNDSDNQPRIVDNRFAAAIDAATAHLPSLSLGDSADKSGKSPDKEPSRNRIAEFLIPEEIQATPQGEAATMSDPELAAPIDAKTMQALTKDSDQFAPVHNADGSTTYTVVQAGITDRPGRDNGVDFYRRTVDVTVPVDRPSLDDCKYVFNPRETISKDDYEKIIEKDKATSPQVELYAHGISTSDTSADKQALMLQLSNGRPTINLDWAATLVPGNNPINSIKGYAADTIAAKRANENPDFQSAIDSTINEIGANRTDMIGFSHGGFFDARYLAHRVADNLPKLNTVILTHPDVPISAGELSVNGKPELLKDSAQHSYVVGGQLDLALKVAVLASYCLPGTPTFENMRTEERLGNNSNTTRSFIEQEGAMPIEERDRKELCTEHFLNYAGMRQLLDAGDSVSKNEEQSSYNAATDIGRLNLHYLAKLTDDFLTAPTEQQILAS